MHDQVSSSASFALALSARKASSKLSMKNDTTEEEPAARMIDEKCRRDYKRARLTVSTTRCSPGAADLNGQAIGGARSGGE